MIQYSQPFIHYSDSPFHLMRISSQSTVFRYVKTAVECSPDPYTHSKGSLRRPELALGTPQSYANASSSGNISSITFLNGTENGKSSTSSSSGPVRCPSRPSENFLYTFGFLSRAFNHELYYRSDIINFISILIHLKGMRLRKRPVSSTL